ncbi:MAG: hypothetical protein A2359_00285 [Candidatus Moranbacteria bacterium RIFOXYB1_FULL_43_19]|nr:MAG: hypothetical protein A2359_00285 [Candidatus Moranbacteria bacterium RIFOXYB1_FULL_43_19]OGI28099.1 MAG: hypothetical protein A2184_04355 [Candidatus Moranbacteria bacterium RIFOXYA1_FULL_44_7]OGI33743.1 MAG: hypothetical protein A2420_04920 [Candidatus Moranbacteria bacterium RIFOXYC1_FULL_44_13]OGI38030.1 MAG: hypothetical protein A2612_00470 [Candidatus Moranbacteria bacterium RIFOXYD1_FULL_44_12]
MCSAAYWRFCSQYFVFLTDSEGSAGMIQKFLWETHSEHSSLFNNIALSIVVFGRKVAIAL